jgi:hypothetical protein
MRSRAVLSDRRARLPYRSRIGTVIKDRYEIVGLIGQGGQSAVFQARDRTDGDEAAGTRSPF